MAKQLDSSPLVSVVIPVWNTEDNIEKLRSVYEMLCDYQSKLIYKTMIEAHYTRNIDVLSRTCGTIQYFSEQDILNFGTEEVFVDAGAFDGDTVEPLF